MRSHASRFLLFVAASRRLYGDSEARSSAPFPVAWSAPETYGGKHLSSRSDVWSFGIVLWEVLMYGADPSMGISPNEYMNFVMDGNRLPNPASCGSYCSDALYKLMQDCWGTVPEGRPGFAQVKEMLEAELELLLGNEGGADEPPTPAGVSSQAALAESASQLKLV